ncbi:hypothetical protein GCM10009740_31760 [Terrabacter terrae]|uniref:DUF3263 domain-containing protein n=1 Tax=Terrabacter terrae TaxID=318434 RepID=A0ABN2UH39_9MICO
MIGELLAFERRWLNDPRAGDGRKAQAILETFGVNETRYYQRLVAALGTREAWESDPGTTALLRERLASRSRGRRAG